MASMDTFKPAQINNQKLPDSVMGGPFVSCSSIGAFHSHILDSPKASISIEDLDILDGPDALRFFEQEALFGDASLFFHVNASQNSPRELGSSWSLDELDGVQHTPTAAIVTSSMRCTPSASHHAESGTIQQGKLSSLPVARDRSAKTQPFSNLKFAKIASKHVNWVDSDDTNDGKASHMGKTSSSKNIFSERKRRRKLNEKLYSLRSLVPKISKMDKASIVNDAINYVQNLQKLVKDMQDEIHTLQTRASGDTEEPLQCAANGGLVSVTSKLKEVDYKILKVEVAKMEATTYNLRILCLRGRGVFVKLAKALESLQFEIVNANLTSIKDQTLNTIFMKKVITHLAGLPAPIRGYGASPAEAHDVVAIREMGNLVGKCLKRLVMVHMSIQAKDGRTMEPRELREMILEVVPRFGLGLAKEGGIRT